MRQCSKTQLGLSFLLMTALAACSKPGKMNPAADGSSATFRVESGKAVGHTDPLIDGDAWSKPFSDTFTFTACMVDVALDKKLLGQKFRIVDPAEGAEIDRQEVTPDGCLVWTEPIVFNYFAGRSRWITIERDIVGTGVATGTRRVVYAVNPWLVAERTEIKPAQAGYFLRDDPMDIKDPSVRYLKIYEFFKRSVAQDVQKAGVADVNQGGLGYLGEMLHESAKNPISVLAPVRESTAVLGGQGQPNAKIWVDSVKVLSLKKRNVAISLEDVEKDDPNGPHGFVVQQTIQMTPRLAFYKANGDLVFEDLRSGQFDVYVQVVATDVGFTEQNKKMILSTSAASSAIVAPFDPANNATMANAPKGTGVIIDGKLYAQVSFNLGASVSEGNVDFVIKLVPHGIGNRAPQEFIGIFNMSKPNSWIANVSTGMLASQCIPTMNVSAASDCGIKDYFKSTSSYQDMLKLGEASPNQAYLFQHVKPRFTQVVTGQVIPALDGSGGLETDVGETATRRTVLYAASSCVNAGGTGDKIAHQQFIIHVKSEEPGPLDNGEMVTREKTFHVKLDDNSCLNWTNRITHYYYRPEQFFRQELVIEGPGGFRTKKVVYINPWDDKFTFGFDEEELGKEFFDAVAKRPKIPSRFFTGDYSYHTNRFLYGIDNYMDLDVKKTVLMDFQPRVLRYSGLLAGRKVTESLRDGIYLLKVGIQKSYLDPADRFRKLCEVDRARDVTDSMGRPGQPHWERAVSDDPQVCALSRPERRLTKDDQLRAAEKPHTNLELYQENVVGKEFVTTKTTLVRVTDGLVIQPVELSMKDLRLMRIRSNFLLQLQTVDESKVMLSDQVDSTFRNYVQNTLAAKRKQDEAFRAQALGPNGEADDAAIDADRKDKDAILEANAQATRAKLQDIYQGELSRLNQNSNIIANFAVDVKNLQGLIDDFDADKDMTTIAPNYPGLTPARLADLKQRYEIYKKVAQNDFTQVSLPDCGKVDCEAFVDAESGLKRRTFVGPVIFLSNSYRDAMRATDNLDEARCHEEIDGVDYDLAKLSPLESSLLSMETGLLTAHSKELYDAAEPTSYNKAYTYNKYFNSLRQFCTRTVKTPGDRDRVEFYPKQVDDLIKDEQVWKNDYASKMKALATPYTFAATYNLEFVSFGGEKLRKIDEKMVNNKCLDQGIDTCMVPTNEHTLTVSQLVERANRNLQARTNLIPHWPWAPLVNKDAFDVNDVKNGIFGRDYTGDGFTSVCGELASMMGENYRSTVGGVSDEEATYFENLVFEQCIDHGKKAFLRDRKMRIYETGSDYVFMGGMQLNFNVGTSFSVSRSNGNSAGFDYLDTFSSVLGGVGLVGGAIFGNVPGAVIGGAAGGFIGEATKLVLKPFDVKSSKGMSDSSGTSITDGTYLVGQVAKFSIPVKRWEECVVIRPRPELVQDLAAWAAELPRNTRQNTALYRHLRGTDDHPYSDEEFAGLVNKIFDYGLFVCDGISRTQETDANGQAHEKSIEELYFYFTQHFTEGDMLDQADLYNHPWLLSLRGLRDFSSFVQLIRGQEVTDLPTFVDGLTSNPPPKSGQAGWSLDHMANTYKAIIPSFPGLYTELEQENGMDYFTLDPKRFSRTDLDINAEVNRRVDDVLPTNNLKIGSPLAVSGDGGN